MSNRFIVIEGLWLEGETGITSLPITDSGISFSYPGENLVVHSHIVF